MSNLFDGEIVLEYLEGAVVFRDIALGINKMKVLYTAADPNGMISAPQGSIASGPAGAFVNSDGATAWSPLGAGFDGAPERFVFRPGGTPGGNVHIDFGLLYIAMSAAQGIKELVIDTSIVSPAVIPDGIYDFTNVAVTDGNLMATQTAALDKAALTFGQNVEIRNAYSWENISIIGPAAPSVSPPIRYDSGSPHLVSLRNCLVSFGGGPRVILVDGAGTIVGFAFSGAPVFGGLNNAGGEPLYCSNGAICSFIFSGRNSAGPSCIASDATAGTGSISFTDEASAQGLTPANQPNWLGSLSPLDRASEARRVEFNPATSTWSAPDPVELQDAVARMNVAWNAMNTALAAALVPGFPLPSP